MKKTPAVLLAITALAFPASASAKMAFCPTESANESLAVKQVTCGKARTVLEKYYADKALPKGWSCDQQRNPAGQKTTCRNGAKKIVYATAD